MSVASENKAKILDWYDSNRRPNPRSKNIDEKKLGTALAEYLRANRSSFDPDFARLVREKFPKWFSKRMSTKDMKEQILKWPNRVLGPNRCSPDKVERSLASALDRYLKKNTTSYDGNFEVLIREKYPNWFYMGVNSGLKRHKKKRSNWWFFRDY